MGINNEYNDDYWWDDWTIPGEDENEDDRVIMDREDLEDMYSDELLNMWFLIHEEFPEKTYQSFCEFILGTNEIEQSHEVPPEYIVSLWRSVVQELGFLLEDRTLTDFFVYLYKQ